MILRVFISLVLLIVIAGVITYYSIPSPLKISGRVVLQTSSNGAYRVLTRQDVWNKMSTEKVSIVRKLVNTVEVNVKNKNANVPVSLFLIPLSRDSVAISWSSTFPVVKNPISKIRQYGRAVSVKENMHNALENFQSFVQHSENIYGLHIEERSISDTFLIAIKFNTSAFPTNNVIYSYIERLRSFASASGANQTNPPMLNISTVDSIHYQNMVAIPINKIIERKDSISFIRMVSGGFRFLTTEIKGGPHTIHNAHKTMEQYFSDFGRISMAIPFEYLITNRLQETDTTKWVTRIYNPVY